MPTRRFAQPLGAAVCAIALTLLPFLAYAQNAQPTGRGRDITGTVVDTDGNPVAGANVAIGGGGPSAATGADGSFHLAGVATANLMIEISAAGFTTRQMPVLGAATPLVLQVVIVHPAPAAPPPSETRLVGGVVTDAAHAPVA